MNYFGIFNKVMLELNYRPVNVFANIFKNEHLRILQNIARVNSEVCNSHDWDFLRKMGQFKILAGKRNFENEPEGKITAIYENGTKFNYNNNFQDFFNDSAAPNSYGVFDGRVIFTKNSAEKTLDVFYTTKNFALDGNGAPKLNLESENDISIIPKPFCEDILVYGACTKTKANPSFPKFAFWNSTYIRALGRMRSENSATHEDSPYLSIEGRKSV